MDDKKQMTELFKGYTSYSKEEYNSIWENSFIVVDANILLNFYRYSIETRKELFETLNIFKNRLWIPYQVGYEYFKKKNSVMASSYNDYDSLNKNIKEAFNSAINEIKTKKIIP